LSTKCLMILSSKSAGSSALQYFLTKNPQVNHISKTRHFEHETLYWSKAASCLDLPQLNMAASEVPIKKDKARIDLISLLKDNLDSYDPPEEIDELIFTGWKLLCQQYAPVFLEKSPHHLFNWPVLELILECTKRLPEIDFFFIGLIRNPMDTLYSMWKRFKILPEKSQAQWLIEYSNLLTFKKSVGDRLIILKYEDLVENTDCLEPVYKFIGIDDYQTDKIYFHSQSIGKWKKDRYFGFRLSKEVLTLSEKFGYERQALLNKEKFLWPYYKWLARGVNRITYPLRTVLLNVKKKTINSPN